MTTPTISDPVEGIRLYLLTKSTLATYCSSRIAYEELPRELVGSMPVRAVVISAAGGRGPGVIRARTQRVDIRCYGETPGTAKILSALVNMELRRIPRVTSGKTLVYAAVCESDGFMLRDPDTDWPFVLSTFAVFAAEDAAP